MDENDLHIEDQVGHTGFDYGVTETAQACEDALKG